MPKLSMDGIHRGAVTHHQDQVITLVNFKTRNTINVLTSKPGLTLTVTLSLIFY